MNSCKCGEDKNNTCSCGHNHKSESEQIQSHNHQHCESCGCGHDHSHSDGDVKKGIIRIAVGLAALTAAIFTEGYLSIGLFLTAYLIFGYDVVINAVKSVCKGKALDEHFLMAFATICAFCLGELVEAVAVMLFYQIGEFLQETIVNKSRKSIKSLAD